MGMGEARILVGDVRTRLAEIPDGSVQTCVTSPPYWGLRDYGHGGQLGLEPTPQEYVAHMVDVFREVRRVLADDGTCWLNLGDSYAANRSYQVTPTKWASLDFAEANATKVPDGLKPKDLVGIPWRVAFALQADGWWLRQDIIWAKPNPMPESVTDRCTKAHEYLFLLTKSARYYYDAAAVSEPSDHLNLVGKTQKISYHDESAMRSDGDRVVVRGGTRNRRSVWTIPTKPFPGSHFAVMPEALVEPCVLAGSRPGDLVLDPFTGSGTVGVVALKHGRDFIGTELNPEYAAMAHDRITDDGPLFNRVEVA